MQRSALVRLLYERTAPRYEAHIAPVMRPFAQSLIREARLNARDVVLDLGTGTGVLLREIVGRVRLALGLDIAFPMLQIARSSRPRRGRAALVQADAHTLACLPDACCDLVFASFGLGETDPHHALRAIARVLRPGRRLFFQEWGPLDGPNDPRRIVDETLADFATPQVTGLRQAFRELLADPSPWDRHLQDVEDYQAALAEAGFSESRVRETRPVTVTFSPGMARFLDYAFAWEPRHLERQAMDPATRRALGAECARRLAPLLDLDGTLYWSPIIFRATAVCKL